MQVLHEAECPGLGVLDRLLESDHDRRLALVVDAVALHALVRNLALLLVEPAGRQGRVGEQPEAEQADESRGCTLEDEEPES